MNIRGSSETILLNEKHVAVTGDEHFQDHESILVLCHFLNL